MCEVNTVRSQHGLSIRSTVHLNIRTKCGKEGSLREDLRQEIEKIEKNLLLQTACCGIFYA